MTGVADAVSRGAGDRRCPGTGGHVKAEQGGADRLSSGPSGVSARHWLAAYARKLVRGGTEAGYDAIVWLSGLCYAGWLTRDMPGTHDRMPALAAAALIVCLLSVLSGLLAARYRGPAPERQPGCGLRYGLRPDAPGHSPTGGRDARIRLRPDRDCPRHRAVSQRSMPSPFPGTRREDWRGRCDAPGSAGRCAEPSRRTSQRRDRDPSGGAPPACASPGGQAAGQRRARGIGASLELDKELPEDVATFQPRETGTEVRQRINRVDHRPHAGGDTVQRAAKCVQRRTERADDAVLLLEELHQVDAAGWSRRGTARHQATAAPNDSSEPLQVSAPTCSNTTSTPLRAVSLRTTPSKRSVR